MNDTSPQCVWPLSAELGEGPVWIAEEKAVYFVNIEGKSIHRFFVDSGRQDSWATPGHPGFLLPEKNGTFICGLTTGLYRFDPSRTNEQQFVLVQQVERHVTGNRLNDGYVDAHGRLWFGSMDNSESQPKGTLYRWSANEVLPQDQNYVVTNGPAMSPDNGTLYHTDTLKRCIYAFDASDDGELTNKRTFLNLINNSGYPDGMAVDAEGCVWIAFFGGWRIDRHSPEGAFMGSVRFPCANVTKLAFGGNDLHTVYVTTATKGLSDEERLRQPLAGGLFSFRSPVPGLPQNYCTTGIKP